MKPAAWRRAYWLAPAATARANMRGLLQRTPARSRCGRNVGDCSVAQARQRESQCFRTGDLLDEVDDAPPQLGVGDAHECLGQRQAIGGSKKVGHISRRGRFAQSVCRAAPPARGRALEKERHRDLKDMGNLLQVGSRRSGWCPFRIFAPAETSGRGESQASPGSSRASCGACARGCRHACRWGSVPSWPSYSTVLLVARAHLAVIAIHDKICSSVNIVVQLLLSGRVAFLETARNEISSQYMQVMLHRNVAPENLRI